MHSDDLEALYEGFPDRVAGGSKLIGGMIFLLVVAAILGTGARWALDPATLPIRNVRVGGEFRQLAPGILQDTVTDVVRGGFFNVNVEKVQSTLLENPWVRDVTVSRIWPDGIDVQIVEQQPVARWGETALVNNDAELFSPAPGTFPEELPEFNGPDNTGLLLLNRYRQITDALADTGLKVVAVTLDERWAWSFTLDGGPQIRLGRREVSTRIHRFTKLLKTELGDRLQEFEFMDMRYTNGLAIRWKEQAAVIVEPGRNHHG